MLLDAETIQLSGGIPKAMGCRENGHGACCTTDRHSIYLDSIEAYVAPISTNFTHKTSFQVAYSNCLVCRARQHRSVDLVNVYNRAVTQNTNAPNRLKHVNHGVRPTHRDSGYLEIKLQGWDEPDSDEP